MKGEGFGKGAGRSIVTLFFTDGSKLEVFN